MDVADEVVFDVFVTVRVAVAVSVELGAVVESVTDAEETMTYRYFISYVDKWVCYSHTIHSPRRISFPVC